MGLAGNELAHALKFKVESGSKSAVIIQYFITVLRNKLLLYQVKNHIVANSYY